MDKKTKIIEAIVRTPEKLRSDVEKFAVAPLKDVLKSFWDDFEGSKPFEALLKTYPSLSTEATFEDAIDDTKSKLFRAFKQFLGDNDFYLQFYGQYKTLVNMGNYDEFMKHFHELIKDDQFPDFEDNKEVKNTVIKLHDEYWDSEKDMPKVYRDPPSSGTKKQRNKVIKLAKPDLPTKEKVDTQIPSDLVSAIMELAVVPFTKCLSGEPWINFKKSKEFKNMQYSLTTDTDALVALALDGTSDLFKAFKKFCKKSNCQEILERLVKFKTLMMKDNYKAFMVSFHDLIVNKDHDGLSSDQKDGLKAMHKKYWDVKRGEPMDVSEMKPKKEVDDPKALITSDSKPDPTKEKPKGEKAKKKEEGGGQSDADLSHEGGSRQRGDRKTSQPGEGKAPKDIGSNSDKGKKEAKEKKEKGGGKS
jgi:hypothetical protein